MTRNWQKRGMKNIVILIDTNAVFDFDVARNVQDFRYSKGKAITSKGLLDMEEARKKVLVILEVCGNTLVI